MVPSSSRAQVLPAAEDEGSLPAWLKGALSELRAIDGPPDWSQLVEGLRRFEERLGFPSGKVRFFLVVPMLAQFYFQGKAYSISAKGRPSEISHWTKNARSPSAVPKIKDVGNWASSWRAWWILLQPESRKGEKLLRVVESGEPWAEIKKGGINGFYTIVVSLGWWLQALEKKGERTEFAKMLNDVLWVCDCISGDDKGVAKHARDESGKNGEEHVSKRFVFSLCDFNG